MTAELQSPYLIKFENIYNTPARCKLFGYKPHNDIPNYGNPEGIVITNLQSGSYQRVLSQSQHKEFKIGKLRIWADSDFLLETVLVFNEEDESGKHYMIPINLLDHYDLSQGNTSVVDVVKQIEVKENVWLEFNLPANKKMVFAIYPIKF